MAIYYKYYSYLPPEYFERPTIKIASPAHLNDPFESLLPDDIKKYIEQFAEDNQSTLNYEKELVVKALNNVMRSFGVTSLSETQRNLLMWAHYANEHQGLCIGYDTDIIFDKKTKKMLKEDAELKKVNYDTVRHEDYGNLKKMEGMKEFVDYILQKIMLTKGNDWIYEKEHRYIVDLGMSSYVQVPRDNKKRPDELNKKINSMIERNVIIEKEISKNPDVTCYIPSTQDARIGFGYLNFHKEASYFLNINPKSIKRVYFGCRTPNQQIKEIFDAIIENKNIFDGVLVNRMQLSKKRFELCIPAEFEAFVSPDS
ncbi:DUF2971 domain-containing protein [Aeromonas veronii]|uniref:DUF2971 domain-containing protein n=1 Tax=Aeromonas veronii TaxID=654 RepID=UPI0031598CC3